MEYFIITIVSLLIGYFLGQGKITVTNAKEAITQKITQVKKKLDTSPVGVIHAPSARDIWLKEHPQVKEGMEEMAKDLKEKGI